MTNAKQQGNIILDIFHSNKYSYDSVQIPIIGLTKKFGFFPIKCNRKTQMNFFGQLNYFILTLQ